MRLLAALAIWSVSLSAVAAAACVHPSESDAVAATALVQSRLKVSDFSADMCQVKSYIVLQWHEGDGYSAGQALTKKDGSTWAIVRMTTGSLKNVALLESLGVPATTAAALADDIVP
jgi:hypothetical protein